MCRPPVYSIRADKVRTRKDKINTATADHLAKNLIESLGKIEQESTRNHGGPRTQPCQHEHRAVGEQYQYHGGPGHQHVSRHLHQHQNSLQRRHKGKDGHECYMIWVRSVTINCRGAGKFGLVDLN